MFGLPEIKAGTLADAAMLKLPKRHPDHVAMELLDRTLHERQEAQRWLVNEALLDHDALMSPRALGGRSPARVAASCLEETAHP